jgi:hypothetical protein
MDRAQRDRALHASWSESKDLEEREAIKRTCASSMPVGETADIGVGVDVGLFGLGGISHWSGVLGGPTASPGSCRSASL